MDIDYFMAFVMPKINILGKMSISYPAEKGDSAS